MKKFVIVYFLDVENEQKFFIDFSNAEQYAIQNEMDEDLIEEKTITEDEGLLLWNAGSFLDSDPEKDKEPFFDFLDNEEENETEEEEEEAPKQTEPKKEPVKSLDKMTKAELLGQLQNLAVQVAELQKNSVQPQKLSFEELKKQYEEKSRLLGLRDTLKNELVNMKSVFFTPDHAHPFQVNGFSIAFMKETQIFLKLQSAFILEKFKSFIVEEMQNEIQQIESKI